MSCHCHKKECCQEYKSESGEKERGKTKNNIQKVLLVLAIVIFGVSFVLPIGDNIKIGIYIAVIILAGYEIMLEGVKHIFQFNFEEDTLMTIAVIAAFILGEFHEACLVILLFKLGEMIEGKAIDKSNSHIENVVSIKATNANLVKGDTIEVVDVGTLKIGDTILIKPGENVPVDSKVISGDSYLDVSALTGESRKSYVTEGAVLLSGSINLEGSLTCIVEKQFKDSTATQIVDLVYEAQNNKGKTEEFITKFSKIYTPVVIVVAILIAVIPIIIGLQAKEWVMRALVFLVASCPCSIVISIPLALYTCLGSISKKGMLMKGTKHIEDLSKAKIVAFDKTGTLTTGKMEIAEIEKIGHYSQEEILEYAYCLERNSSHPIASSISKRIEELGLNGKIQIKEVKEYKEVAGCGICGKVEDKFVVFGNKKMLRQYDVGIQNLDDNKNYLVVDGEVIGSVSLKEELRSEICTLFTSLKQIGIKKIVMLTGDNEKNAQKIAQAVDIKEVYASLLPKQKLDRIEALKKEGNTIFVGDGINDSPVLASADFSIAMGEGTEIANNTADSILVSNHLGVLPEIIQISRKTMRILKQNIIFSLMMKLFVLIAGVAGFAPIWLAVFADVGVTLLTVLNAIR